MQKDKVSTHIELHSNANKHTRLARLAWSCPTLKQSNMTSCCVVSAIKNLTALARIWINWNIDFFASEKFCFFLYKKDDNQYLNRVAVITLMIDGYFWDHGKTNHTEQDNEEDSNNNYDDAADDNDDDDDDICKKSWKGAVEWIVELIHSLGYSESGKLSVPRAPESHLSKDKRLNIWKI